MAQATFQPKGLPILQAFSQIENIKAQRAATGLEQDRFTLGQQQLAQENARQVEQDKIAADQRQFARDEIELDRNEELLKDLNISDTAFTGVLGRSNAIIGGRGGFQIDAELALRDRKKFAQDLKHFGNIKNQLGEDNPIVQEEFGFLQAQYALDPTRAKAVATVGAGVAAEQKIEREAGRKERLFPAELKRAKQKEQALAGLRAEERVTVRAEDTTERERRASVIKGFGLDTEAEKQALAAIEAGVSIKDPRERERTENIQTLNLIGKQLNQQNVDDEFVIQGAPRARLQEKFNSLLADVVGEDVLSRPAAAPAAETQEQKAAKQQSKKSNIKEFLKIFKTGEIKDAKEVLEDIDKLNPGLLDKDLEQQDVIDIMDTLKKGILNKQRGIETLRDAKQFIKKQLRQKLTIGAKALGEKRIKEFLGK